MSPGIMMIETEVTKNKDLKRKIFIKMAIEEEDFNIIAAEPLTIITIETEEDVEVVEDVKVIAKEETTMKIIIRMVEEDNIIDLEALIKIILIIIIVKIKIIEKTETTVNEISVIIIINM